MPYHGRKRKKTRTHRDPLPGSELEKIPRSFVFQRGNVDKTVRELVKDMRTVMAPHTAARLEERKSNTLKDFVHIAGPLGITHLFVFSQSERRVNLRIGRLPRGPTLSFAVESFTLARQIKASQKRPVDLSVAFLSPPLLITSNMNAAATESLGTTSTGVSIGNALRLVHSTLQASFPPLNPATLKLSEVRRVLLVHYDKDTGVIEMRQYIIRAKPVGVSHAVSRLSQSRLPDLSNVEDVADWVASQGGYESEAEDEASRVTLPQNYAGVGNHSNSLSAIRLTEIGPRMSLRLVKIEAGMATGEVLYHAFVTKTKKERQELEQRALEKERLKKERKAIQEENVARKEAKKAEKLERKRKRLEEKQRLAEERAAIGTLGEEGDDETDEDEDSSDDSDDVHSEEEFSVSDSDSDDTEDEDSDDSGHDDTSEDERPVSKRRRAEAPETDSSESEEEGSGRGGSRNKKGAFIMPAKTMLRKRK